MKTRVSQHSPRLKTLAAVFLTAVLAAAVAGCGAGTQGSTPEQAGEPSGEATPETSPSPEPEDEGRTTDSGFNTDGFVAASGDSGGTAGTADRIESVRFQVFDGYERLLLDFGQQGGEVSSVPRWSVTSPPEGGYVRIHLPDVTSTATGSEDFVGSVLDELYVVRDRGGGLFVDVFAMREFRYRVTELPESGRLAVDFRRARGGLELPPTKSDKVVVVQPREAEEVSSPLTVEGYARLFEGRVTVSLLDREREVISTETVRANDWATAWGLFEATLEVPDYEGRATLRVGGESPRDGSFVGTETEVFIE
ncbi:MAG: Gmad2 immunoglobulin-like domain-containing protein [Rubrobacter sp.]|nr:Gmad2 immunoglobulin-like domain-containing protein [Rubrobacter sp.]